ncbi:MAG: hypothetical protein ACOVP1_09525 [Bacteroidia bacterium]
MKNKEMNELEALQIIESMINKTKKEISDNGFYWILWGWLVFISALVDYTLMVFFQHDLHALVWAIMMPLGGIITAIKGRKESIEKSKSAKTYVDELMKYVITAYVISLLIICFIMPMHPDTWKSFYPVIMVLYATITYITGGIVKSKALRMGSFLNWACAITAFFVTYDWQLLLLALAVLGGFIIPGHILNKEFKAQHV